MKMLCELNYKKVAIDYSFYSVKIRLKCPFCSHSTSNKTKKYDSLKSLVYHLSNEHKNEGSYYPFSLDDIKSVLPMIALAKQWRLLD